MGFNRKLISFLFSLSFSQECLGSQLNLGHENEEGFDFQYASSTENPYAGVSSENFILALSQMAGNYSSPAKTVPSILNPADQNAQTASHTLLEELFIKIVGEENDSENTDLVSKIEIVVNKQSNGFLIDRNQAQILADIIEVEKSHADKIVMYHGLTPQIWLCFRVLSHLRHTLNQSDIQTSVLRSFDAFFDHLPTATDLLNYIAQGNQNYAPGLKRVALSCNPSLLSSLHDASVSTVQYFFESYSSSPPKNVWSILTFFFDYLGIQSDDLLGKFQDIVKIHFSDQPGCLLQFFIDPAIVDDVSCITGEGGFVLHEKKGKNILKNTARLLEDFKRGTFLDTETPKEKIQTRLHSNLFTFPKGQIEVYDYFSNGNAGRLKAIDLSLRDILKEVVVAIHQNLFQGNQAYKLQTPSLVEVSQKFFNRGNTVSEEDNPIARTILSNDNEQIARLYLENPEYFQGTYYDLDALEVRNINSHRFIEILLNTEKKTIKRALVLINQEKFRLRIQNLFTEIERIPTTLIFDFFEKRVSKELSADEAQEVLYISTLFGEKTVEILEISSPLIHEGLDGNDVQTILKTIFELGENAAEVINASKSLIQESMDGDDVRAILKSVSKLGENAAEVINISKSLIQESMDGDDVRATLKSVSKLGENAAEVIEASKALIQESMDGDDVRVILKSVLKLGENASKVIEASQTLIRKNMCGNDIKAILQGVSELDQEKTQKIIDSIKLHVTEEMNGNQIVRLFKYSDLGW